MHTLPDYDGNLPAYVNITDGKTADNKGASDIPIHKGSVTVAGRFSNNSSLLKVWHSNKVFFLVRHKENLQCIKIKENDWPDDRQEHMLTEEIIELKNNSSKQKYPDRLGRIAV